MDLRVLKYFLETAETGSIAKASGELHTTAPNISRQIAGLEAEFGTKLFRKEGRGLVLTDDGLFFKSRAKEIVLLAERTETDMRGRTQDICGNVFIGAAETPAMRKFAPLIASITGEYPTVSFRIHSGDAELVSDGLDSGVFDFGILCEPADIKKYGHIKLPVSDKWGLLLQKDSSLSRLPFVSPKDLVGVPLMCSEQMLGGNGLVGWSGKYYDKLRFILTFNLITTAAMLAETGVGCVLTFKDLVTADEKILCFRLLNPPLETGLYLVWRQDKHFSKAAQIFLERFRKNILP